MQQDEWVQLSPDVLTEADQLAQQQAESIFKRPVARRGRSLEQIKQQSKRGIIAEMHHNRDDLKWWREHWLQAQENGDDGGGDDRQGNGVKVVRPGDKRVFCGDLRPEKQFVYLFDEQNARIRLLGTFQRSDVHDLPCGNDTYSGVYVDELQV